MSQRNQSTNNKNNMTLGNRVQALPHDLQGIIQTQFINQVLRDKTAIVKLLWAHIANGNTTPIDNALFKRLAEGDPILTLGVFIDLYSTWKAQSTEEIPPLLLRKVLNVSSKMDRSMQPVIPVTIINQGLKPIVNKEPPNVLDVRTQSYVAIKAIKSYFACLQSGRSGPFSLIQKKTKSQKPHVTVSTIRKKVPKIKSAHDVYEFCMNSSIYNDLIVVDDWIELIKPAIPIGKPKKMFTWQVPSEEVDNIWKRIPDEIISQLVKKRLKIDELSPDPMVLLNQMVRADVFTPLSHHLVMQKWQAYCKGKGTPPDVRIFILQHFIAQNMSFRASILE